MHNFQLLFSLKTWIAKTTTFEFGGCLMESITGFEPMTIPLLLRCCLIGLLVACRGGSFMVEQPGGSYMEYYDKMVWLYSKVPVV